MMSQPVRNASAPRLAPPRRKSRRVGSGISFAASRMRSLESTPGGSFRMRDIASSLAHVRKSGISFPNEHAQNQNLAAGDHGAQRLWHHEGHDHVDDEKADDGRHGKE